MTRFVGPQARSTRPLLWLLPVVGLIAQAIASFDRLKMVLYAVAPLLVAMFLNVELGVFAMLGFATVVPFIKRMMPDLDSNQVGLVIEGMLVLMGLRLLVDQVRNLDLRAFRTPVTWALLAFTGYQMVEIFNPFAPSLQFGIYGMRDTLRVLGVFIVLTYFRARPRIHRLVIGWLAILFVEGLYGIFQHHHGLLNQEYLWLITTNAWKTHILNGYVRVFGTVGDAATFGFIEVTGALMLIGLALTSRGWKLVALLALAVPMLYAMVVSYSRGPIVGLAAGLAAILLASRNWKLALGTVGLVALLGLGLSTAGQANLLDRVLTAAKPGEDASFLVRMGYLNDYLPRLLERPFGSGLWTAGASGLSLTGGVNLPGTTIGIPTDNNYFKYGLEMGYVGVGLFVWLLSTLVWSTFRTYQRLTEPTMKAIALGLLGVFACYAVGAFSNDIFVQKPIGEWFYVAIGLSMLLGQFRERWS
jgi:hypothetical protein